MKPVLCMSLFLSAFSLSVSAGELETKTREFTATYESVYTRIKSKTPTAAQLRVSKETLPNASGEDGLTALKILVTSKSKIWDFDAYVKTAYNSLYSDNRFPLANVVYEAYWKYTTPESWFPTERNTFTYTELYKSECKTTLLQGAAFKNYVEVRKDWLEGKITTENAAGLAGDLLRSAGSKTDLLTFLGALAEVTGDGAKAKKLYWEAHELCPYYNRTNWSLIVLEMKRQAKLAPDYPSKKAKFESFVEKLEVPADTYDYVVNWTLLSKEEQKHLVYAIWMWLPYIKELKGSGARLYMKRGFELTSDRPEVADVRDDRLDYPHDYRLYDDLRGIGGLFVPMDIGQMMMEPYDPVGTTAHEVAHQFQSMLEETPGKPKWKEIAKCIEALYEGAKKRDLFFTPYAGTNHHEYFAEGFGAARYDLNDLKKDDPDFYALKKQILTGRLDTVTCPVEY